MLFQFEMVFNGEKGRSFSGY